MKEKLDLKALFCIGYGLYVLTTKDGPRDNGMIINTVMQVTNQPNRLIVAVNKDNHSYSMIRKTGQLNVNCLDVSAPFSVFQNFGYQSGRNVDKFAGIPELRSENGLRILPEHVNACISLKVREEMDLGTHGLFLCDLEAAAVLSSQETMTYSYYQQEVKPKPQKKKGYVCQICGWVYEGETLPPDLICPVCKHSAEDFAPLA